VIVNFIVNRRLMADRLVDTLLFGMVLISVAGLAYLFILR
jgi:hypothetical protein